MGVGVMNGGPLSVTDAMANYSWSPLRCTAGGADSVLSGGEYPSSICIEKRNHCTTQDSFLGFLYDSVEPHLMLHTKWILLLHPVLVSLNVVAFQFPDKQ